jgi:DNA processing protein
VDQSARLRAWLTLVQAPGIGPRLIARLLAQFGDVGTALGEDAATLRGLGIPAAAIESLRRPDESGLDALVAWAQQDGTAILTLDDPGYPMLLAQIPDPPGVLYVRGDPAVLADPQLAIVGSRNPTPQGAETTRDFAHYLAGCGLTITSGLALGVDAAAHRGALAVGRTVAVLGTGLDRVYPAAHRELARHIAAVGALVSELPPGSPPRAENFPRRNRIISGLSLGTLVTEASLGSGSLITARLAVEQGREVFAMPGSIHNPLARGCHALIRDGARLVESGQDVLAELAPLLGVVTAPVADEAPLRSGAGGNLGLGPDAGQHLDADYRCLLSAMGHDPVAVDDLIRRTGLPADSVASMLLLLELQGRVSSHPGGRYGLGPGAVPGGA